MRKIVLLLISLLFLVMPVSAETFTAGTYPVVPVENQHLIVWCNIDSTTPACGVFRFYLDDESYFWSYTDRNLIGMYRLSGPILTPGTHTLKVEYYHLDLNYRNPQLAYSNVITFTTTNDTSQIPEFPSITAPIAAILGLLLIAKKKRED